MNEKQLLKRLLKNTFSGTVVDKKESANEDIDSQLSSTCLRYITERVEFKPASRADSHLEQLKQKYPPINIKRMETMDTQKEEEGEKRDRKERSVKEDDGIPAPRRVLYDTEKIEMEWGHVRGIGSGLTNMGNTCFLNSVLQCLCYTAPLHQYLKSGDHKSSCQFQGFCAMCELHNHVTRVMNAVGGAIRPVPIVQNIRAIAKHFKFGRQEDAHEFLRYLIDALQKCCLHGLPAKTLDPYSKHTTLVHQIFGGYHRSQVKCLECHKTSNTYDPLLDISLDIKGCVSLGRALSRSTKPDLLSGENKYACPFCKKLTQAQKKFTIHRLPNVLTIHLKRFDYNSLFGGKINKTVEYPEQINMRQYMSNTQGPDEWYMLYAVLVHFGFSSHSGHYYCYVRGPNGTWYCLNDSQVHQVSLNTALSQEAYLLFYSRITNKTTHAHTKDSNSMLPKFKFDPSFLSDQNASIKRAQPIPSLSSSLLMDKRPDASSSTSISSHLKPTGVVTPSLKVPTTSFSSTNTSSSAVASSDENVFELRKSATVSTPKPFPSPSPSSKSPVALPAKPGFTPRAVLKHTKPPASKPLFPHLTHDQKKEIAATGSPTQRSNPPPPPPPPPPLPPVSSKEHSTGRSSLSSTSQKSPKIALVQPQPHISKKPVARVLPSLQPPTTIATSLKKLPKTKQCERDHHESDEEECSSRYEREKTKDSITFGPSLPADLGSSVSDTSTLSSLPGMRKEGEGESVKFTFKKTRKKSHHRKHHTSGSEEAEEDRSRNKSKDDGRSRERDSTHSDSLPSSPGDKQEKSRHRKKRLNESNERDRDLTYKKKKKDHHDRTIEKWDHSAKKEKHGHKSYYAKDHHHHHRGQRTDHTSSKNSTDQCKDSETLKTKKKEHELSVDYDRTKRTSTPDHESKRKERSSYSSPSSKVPVVKWEETVGMKAPPTSQSYEHSDVVNTFTSHDELGKTVRSWEGEKNTIDSSKMEGVRKRKGRDDWDWELDRGKKKKFRSQKPSHWHDRNPFQDYHQRSHHGHKQRHHHTHRHHHRRYH